MNLDNLQHYLDNKRVYSNDLNIILTKTPPRVFKFVLVALFFGVIILVFFAWFITYTESFTTNAIYKPDTRSVYFVSEDKKVEQIAGIKTAEISLSTNKTFGEKRQAVVVDSIGFRKVYEANGVIYNDKSELERSGVSFDNLQQKYAVNCYVSPASVGSVIDRSGNLLQVSFPLRKKRLISKYLKFL